MHIENIKNIFENSINFDKAIYYHFLDSFINRESGDTTLNVNNFLLKNNIVSDDIYTIIINNDNIIYNNMKNGIDKGEIKIDFDNIESLNIIKNIELYKKIFNYAYVCVSQDNHATSILIFEKDNKIYLLLFNSGLGIEIHDSILINDVEYFLPYIGFIISENIEIDTEYEKAIKTIFSILSIIILYERIKSSINNLEEYHIDREMKIKKKFINLSKFINILKQLDNLINTDKEQIIININYNNYSIDNLINYDEPETKIYIKSNGNIDDIDDIDELNIKNLVDYNILTINKNYYQLISEILLKSQLTKFNITNLGLTNYSLLDNITLNEYNCDNNKIIDKIINKQILHLYESQLYILAQDSGSCSWFSKYWPIIFYNIFNNKDINIYVSNIKKINNICYNLVSNIFTEENFRILLNENYTLFVYMKQMCSKLIDIELLDKDLLYNSNDIIYNDSYNFTIKDITHNIINIEKNYLFDIENIEIKYNENRNYNTYDIKYIVDFIYYEEYLDIFCFFIYRDESKNGKDYFSETVTEIDLDTIERHIYNIFDEILKTSSDEILDKFKMNFRHDFFVKKLKKYIKNISNIYEKFLKTYDTYELYNEPSNYINYVPYAMYINDYLVDMGQNSFFDFNDQTQYYNLNRYIKHMIRFEIFIKILNQIHKLINNIIIDIRDFEFLKFTFAKYEKYFNIIKINIGNYLYNQIIYRLITTKYNFSFDYNYFINREREINFNFKINYFMTILSSTYNYNINNHKKLISYNIPLNNYNKTKIFLYNNPIYLHENFNNNDEINYYNSYNSYIFLKLNIFDIFKTSNEEYRNKLILFYLNIWYDLKDFQYVSEQMFKSIDFKLYDKEDVKKISLDIDNKIDDLYDDVENVTPIISYYEDIRIAFRLNIMSNFYFDSSFELSKTSIQINKEDEKLIYFKERYSIFLKQINDFWTEKEIEKELYQNKILEYKKIEEQLLEFEQMDKKSYQEELEKLDKLTKEELFQEFEKKVEKDSEEYFQRKLERYSKMEEQSQEQSQEQSHEQSQEQSHEPLQKKFQEFQLKENKMIKKNKIEKLLYQKKLLEFELILNFKKIIENNKDFEKIDINYKLFLTIVIDSINDLKIKFYKLINKNIIKYKEEINLQKNKQKQIISLQNLSLLFFKTYKFDNLDTCLKDILLKMNNSKEKFCNYLIDNKDNFVNFNIILLFKIINKYFPDYKLFLKKKDYKYKTFAEVLLTKKLSFNDSEFMEKKFECNNISLDDINKYYILINDEFYQIKIINSGIFDSIFNVDSLNFYLININIINQIQGETYIYKLGNDMLIKIRGMFNINDDNIFTIQINQIWYNNFIVKKYNDIIYPFKYVIPQNCFFLIYKNSNTYNVTYFHRKNIINKTLLNHINEPSCIYTITINPETNFYLNKMNHIDYESWIKFCIDYHVNKYNILYINDNDINEKNGYLLTQDSFNIFDKINLNDELKACEYTNITFYNNSRDSDLYIEYIEKNKYSIKLKDITDNFQEYMSKIKFLNKISILSLSDSKTRFDIISKLLKLKTDLQEQINIISFKDYNINVLLDLEYNLLYNYLVMIKILNFIKKLLIELNDNNINNFYGLIKINKEYFNVKEYQFKYKFEALFELILGNELLKEQYKKYQDIINSNIAYDNEQKFKSYDFYKSNKKKYNFNTNIFNVKYKNEIIQSGGTSYPLHHFMMGKGKTKVLTPLLALYFVIIGRKEVLIIMPEHLKTQTEKDIYFYKRFFNLNDNIKILSDSEIKYNFLNAELNDIEKNKNTIMLIDEFDSILDPLQSNFNITDSKTIEINKIINTIKPLIYILKENPEISSINETDVISYKAEIDIISEHEIIKLLVDDINNILLQIKNNKLKENSNWGIHPKFCYAIPYRTKHEPLEKSNFSSCIMIIILTFYYYIIINDFKITKYLHNYLEINNLIEKIFHIKNEDSNLDLLNNIIISYDYSKKQEIFDIILNNIFEQIYLSEYQYNTSFIDIINIDHIFKIGYSGTVNIDLPNIKSDDKFYEIILDYDEHINIKYAINNSEVIYIKDLYLNLNNEKFIIDNLLSNRLLNSYDCLIDVFGLLKNMYNIDVVKILFNNLELSNSRKRDIIFMDEKHEKLIYRDGIIELYSETKIYYKPFIYYSQAHIVGIDIKQDNYPKLLGLCIIDNQSTYTDVAQAMYRMRKLNIGHNVHFLYLNEDFNDNIEQRIQDKILLLLLENDKNKKEEKKDYLIYQTIKSDIRKKRTTKFIDRYKESIKYYYLTENISDLHIFENIFENIFTIDEIIDNDLEELFSKINDKEKIYKLVYGIKSLANEQEMTMIQDNETQIERQMEIQIEKGLDDKIIMIDMNINYDIKFRNLPVYNGDKPEYDLFKCSIKLDNLIYFLPNIFSNSNTNSLLPNISGFVFLYIHEIQKFLIIPGYFVPLYINDYLMLTIKLIYINPILSLNISSEIFNELKVNILIKLLNSEIDIDIDTEGQINNINIYIAGFYIIEKKIKNNYDLKIINRINIDLLNIKNLIMEQIEKSPYYYQYRLNSFLLIYDTEEIDDTEKFEYSGQFKHTGLFEHSEIFEHTEQIEHTGQIEEIDNSGQIEEIHKTKHVEHTFVFEIDKKYKKYKEKYLYLKKNNCKLIKN